MKFIQFAYLAIVAAVSLGAAVMPIAGAPGDHSLDQARSPPSEIVQRWCRRPGQGCYRFKRSDIHDFSKWEPEPVSMKPLPGPKKQMEVDEESPPGERCRRFGQDCYKSKHSADNELNTEPEVEPEPEAEPQSKRWCRRPGQGCYKVKRSESDEEIMGPYMKTDLDEDDSVPESILGLDLDSDAHSEVDV